MEQMKEQKVLWLIPAFLAVHNVEEFFVINNALPGPVTDLPAFLQRLIPVMTRGEFAAALILVTLIPLAAILFGRATSRWTPALLLLMQVQVAVFLNIFYHVFAAFLLGGFSPGLVTAVLINFPFSLLLFRMALKRDWIPLRVFALMFPLGLLIIGPGLVGLLHLISYLG